MLSEILRRHDTIVEGNQLKLRCPLCGKHSLYLAVGEKRLLLANCRRPECEGKGPSILAKLMLPLGKLMSEDLSWLEDTLGVQGRDLSPALGADDLDRVYATWLVACPLTTSDKSGLLARGFTDKDIARNQYGSWQGELHEDRLREGVPGVYVHDGRIRVALSNERYAGILVPCRDVAGRIVGLKVRLNSPDASGKMRTFSSAQWGGPKGYYGTHVPLGVKAPCPRVIVVEGELKADLYYARKQHPVVAIPGVNGV